MTQEETIKRLDDALEHGETDAAGYYAEKLRGTPIKDSGDRTRFATGAVRDMRDGKGRFDLAPLDVIARFVASPLIRDSDVVLLAINEFVCSGDTVFLYEALNDFCEMEYGKKETMMLELAKHFEDGAKKYGEHNWQKGIPVHCFIDSAVRHYLKWLRDDKDEPHDRAFVWNIVCCIWTAEHKPNMCDLPWREENETQE